MSKSETTMGTYIRFTEYPMPPAHKTRLWRVETKERGDVLGEVRWFGRWRKYCFEPFGRAVFEEVCMREISDFIVARTREHREALKAA